MTCLDPNSTLFASLQTRLLERRIFRLHPSSQSLTSKTRCLCLTYDPNSNPKFIKIFQSPQAQLMNNFVSGAIGGFAGTALNTP